MELDLGPEIAQFRAELRTWIAAEAPAELSGLADWRTAMTASGRRAAGLAAAQSDPAYAEWTGKLLARRLICPQWPEEFGGQRMDAVRVAVLNEEFDRAGVPRVTRGMGESLVGPSIIVHGTPEQQATSCRGSSPARMCTARASPSPNTDLTSLRWRRGACWTATR
jgi:alkylation response protein AidB-like acyl-CoA dehydrogenase